VGEPADPAARGVPLPGLLELAEQPTRLPQVLLRHGDAPAGEERRTAGELRQQVLAATHMVVPHRLPAPVADELP
jgi:hypothetical protein